MRNLYINSQLQTCSIQTPGSVLLTDDLTAKLTEYRPCAKAVTDESGNLIDIEYDEEKAAELEAEKAEREEQQEKKILRRERNRLLSTFDKYKSNLLYFGLSESEETREEVTEWYYALLDAPETGVIPDTPAAVKPYL